MGAGKQHGCADDLEFAGFYMEQEESWSGVSSHYLLSVMCFPDTVALERLLCNYVTMKTDFSKERIIYLECSNHMQTTPAVAVAFTSTVYRPEYLYKCQLSCGSIICHRRLGHILKIPPFLLPDNLKRTFTAINQPCVITELQ